MEGEREESEKGGRRQREGRHDENVCYVKVFLIFYTQLCIGYTIVQYIDLHGP